MNGLFARGQSAHGRRPRRHTCRDFRWPKWDKCAPSDIWCRSIQMFPPKRNANAGLRDFLPACGGQLWTPRATSFDFGDLHLRCCLGQEKSKTWRESAPRCATCKGGPSAQSGIYYQGEKIMPHPSAHAFDLWRLSQTTFTAIVMADTAVTSREHVGKWSRTCRATFGKSARRPGGRPAGRP